MDLLSLTRVSEELQLSNSMRSYLCLTRQSRSLLAPPSNRHSEIQCNPLVLFYLLPPCAIIFSYVFISVFILRM